VGKLEEMKTAPQVRGQGVMSLVYGKICDEAKARGVSMLLGGPTSEHSYPIFTNRLGFSAPFRIVNTVCPVRINRVLDWRSAKSDRSFDESDEPPDDCEGFIEDAIAGSRIWTVRDRSYLLWRYTRHPDPYTFLSLRSAGRLSGLAVLKTTHQRGFSLVNTVELFARRGPERRALLRAVREWSQERTQADFVVTWPPTGRPLEGATSGFVPRLGGSTRIVILPLDDVLVELQEILNDRSSWWLGMGDMLDI
jgi:hypothetical protein